MDKYDKLEKIKKLRDEGVLSDEEYERERAKVLNEADNSGQQSQARRSNNEKPWGMSENTYLCLMHLSQILWIAGGAGWILTLFMWLLNKDEFPEIDRHGKEAVNWLISACIYIVACVFLSIVAIGLLGFPLVGIMSVVFPIIAAVKANQGEYWEYPLTIRLIK